MYVYDVQIKFAKSALRDALTVIADMKIDFLGSAEREAILYVKDCIIDAFERLEE